MNGVGLWSRRWNTMTGAQRVAYVEARRELDAHFPQERADVRRALAEFWQRLKAADANRRGAR